MPLFSVAYLQGYRAFTRVSTLFYAIHLGFAVLFPLSGLLVWVGGRSVRKVLPAMG